MPVFWRNKIFLFKLETAYGVDPVPSPATDALLVVDVELTPMEGEDVGRNLDLPWFGNQGTIAAALHARVSFKVELAPSGTPGTPPAWGPLLRACGLAQTVNPGTSVVYSPVTDGIESGHFLLWVGNTRYRIPGARGTATFRVPAQGIPYIEFEFWGLFQPAAEAARGNPVLGAFRKPRVGSTANTPVFTVGGSALVLREFALEMGNAVEPRFLIGSEAILITGREATAEATVEAVPVTTLNPYTLARDSTDVAIQLVHGTGAGNIATFTIPAAQLQRPAGLGDSQNIAEWPLKFNVAAVNGNDDFTLTLT